MFFLISPLAKKGHELESGPIYLSIFVYLSIYLHLYLSTLGGSTVIAWGPQTNDQHCDGKLLNINDKFVMPQFETLVVHTNWYMGANRMLPASFKERTSCRACLQTTSSRTSPGWNAASIWGPTSRETLWGRHKLMMPFFRMWRWRNRPRFGYISLTRSGRCSRTDRARTPGISRDHTCHSSWDPHRRNCPLNGGSKIR